MTLAACAKDVKFYRWPNISFIGVYETPVDCMTVKSISWSCTGQEVLVNVEPYDCVHLTNASVGTFANTSPHLLAFGTENGGVHFYNAKTRQRLAHTFKKLPSNVQNLEFSADDQTVAAGCLSGQIFLYDSKFRPYVSFMIPNSPTLSTMAYSKYMTNLLAGGSKEGVLAVWDTETTDNVLCSKNHDNRITDIEFFGNLLSTVGIDGNFVTYDMRSCTCSFRHELDCPLSSLAYLPNTYEMAISTISGQLRSYDARNMKNPLRTLVAYSNGGIKDIAFPYVRDECFVGHQKNATKSNNDDDYSASGDFSIVADSSAKLCHGYHPDKSPTAPGDCEDEDENAASLVEIIASPKKGRNVDTEDLSKFLEDKVKTSCKDFEDKLFQTFYTLRINTSKQFIGLEEKISQSWNSFVEYLRYSGGTSADNEDELASKENFTQSYGNNENLK
ncbi:hypothetical protein NQ318_001277 [Aromia moschata]|uniref:Uncharacterized protein n=1 Tax=Aromia moschata TaxID=1265417 RepID=A0AAV8ZEF5_9CUCU|nr:hypothetical protein NQ318_001277 [Aromia moschata]